MRLWVAAGKPANLAWESLAEYGARVDIWEVLDVLGSPKGFDLTITSLSDGFVLVARSTGLYPFGQRRRVHSHCS